VVIGLARSRSRHLVYDHEVPRHFVAGQVQAAMKGKIGQRRWGCPVDRLDDGGDKLPPLFRAPADHYGVCNMGMGFQHRFHLFGVHLLSAGVDAQRAAAE
jgi:hypothetical protein